MDEQIKNFTPGVKDLLGNPKQAIRKLSVPMMIGILGLSIYYIVDGFWVAGLGADSLAAVGLFLPFFLLMMALGTGLGIGGYSAIARRIGEKKKKDANIIASHTIALGIVIGFVISLLMLPFIGTIFNSLSGDGQVSAMAIDYARIMLIGAVVFIFVNIANAVLRGEGDAKRAMYGLVLGSGLNILLDPIYIYHLNLGVAGAAWATLTSMLVSSGLFVYWLFVKRDTYLHVTFKNFKFSQEVIKEILSVGLPASLAQISISISIFFINIIVIPIGGTDGVAVYTSGWRIIMIAVLPMLGVAAGVTAVTGAAFGAKNKEKLTVAYMYAIKIGIMIELCVAVVIALFAPQISYIFTYSKGAACISTELVKFLRITAIFYVALPIGMSTTAMFEGIGKGTRSLLVTTLRTLIFQVPMAYLLGVVLEFGLTGIWFGIVIGTIMSALVALTWGKMTIKEIFD